jgi:hypothetical protein
MPFIAHNGRTLLYIHVPKTGGGTVEGWMKTIAPVRFHSVGIPPALRCTPQHLRMADFRSLFGGGFFDHVVMSVRNPYDRIASEYRMRAVIGGKGFWRAFPSFSMWLEQSLADAARNPYHLDNHLRPQWEFHGSGVEVLRYEDGVPAMVARIAALLGVAPPESLPRVHDTSGAGIEVTWDVADILRVNAAYRQDFELFGYPMLTEAPA